MSAAATSPRQLPGGDSGGAANLSSSSLSPPLSSDESTLSPPRATHPDSASHTENSTIVVNFGGGEKPESASATATTTSAISGSKINPPASGARKTTRKKDSDPGNSTTEGRVVKSRSSSAKPRSGPTSTTTTRRKAADGGAGQARVTKSRNAKITDFASGNQAAVGSALKPPAAQAENGHVDAKQNIVAPAPVSVSAPVPVPVPVSVPEQQAPPIQAPAPEPVQPTRSSGQNYDPIRSATAESASTRHPYNTSRVSTPPPLAPPPKSTNRASESPSISSLIDPQPSNVTAPSHSLAKVMNMQPKEKSPAVKEIPPTVQAIEPAPPTSAPAIAQTHTASDIDMDRELERPCTSKAITTAKKATGGASTATSSAAPSPKPHRQKEAPPPPLPPGNGLLSSALFGGPTSAPSDGSDYRAPTVILHIPMKGQTNKYVNFARIAEEAYGWDALHPRLAAQRERLARVTAAGAALEKVAGLASGDEMSVDLSGSESNVEMGGMDGTSEGGKTKKKRKGRADDYDKNDPFVDDSEMLWEEQAAASKDGFFVYSGPLVPEGEKAVIERYECLIRLI